MQTTDSTRFKGPLDCAMQTVRREGVRGLYKGATPPLVGWMCMDSIMMGSLNVYRRVMADHVFHVEKAALPAVGHGMAGSLADCTLSGKAPQCQSGLCTTAASQTAAQGFRLKRVSGQPLLRTVQASGA